VLTACGGGEREPVYNPTPTLVHYDIVDSYGVDTATSSTSLAINPYLDNGMFDIFWKVNSLEDYRVNIRINDRSTPDNSFLIYSDICGANQACDQLGNVICEYTSDFTLSCNSSSRVVDIGELFKQVPQRLYMVLEICDIDSSYCAYDYYPVSME
jgi:hypothetical protein